MVAKDKIISAAFNDTVIIIGRLEKFACKYTGYLVGGCTSVLLGHTSPTSLLGGVDNHT